jgi:DNA primase
MTQRQMEMISPYIPVLCLDADDHGGDATMKIASNLLSFGFKKVSYVRPCVEYKDWNGLFVAKGGEIVSSYINLQEKDYDMSMGEWESMRLKMKGIIR